MSYQANLQESFRAISSTTLDLNGDAMAAMDAELTAAEATVPADFNSRLHAWLQLRLSSSNTNLPGLLAEFRAAEPDGLFDPL